jgi:hypothetical protein
MVPLRLFMIPVGRGQSRRILPTQTRISSFSGKDALLPEALFGLRSNARDVDKGVFKQVATSVSAADPRRITHSADF